MRRAERDDKNPGRGRLVMAAVMLATGLLTAVPAAAEVETWEVDPEHTSVTFKIRHFFSKVHGRFNDFEGTLLLDESDLTTGSVSFSIDAASIDTDEPARDKHLRSDAFFDVENHPRITFSSEEVRRVGEDRLEVVGDLTMRGVTREVTLDVQVLGFGELYNRRRAAFEISTTLNRNDFNVSWNDIVEGGGAVLGKDVEILINLQAKRARKE